MGERHGKIVVACKDFATEEDLIEIRTIKNHANSELAELLEQKFPSSDSEHIVDIEELLLHLENNPILNQVMGITERFWEQAVIDIFINNNDRNNGNWGILRNREGVDRLAPIFDNGGSFQTKISEEKIIKILSDLEKARENAINTQTAYGKQGHILSAARFLDIYKCNVDLQKAVIKVIPNIRKQLPEICEFINRIPEVYYGENNKNYLICSADRKKLFSIQLQARFENLLLPYHKEILEAGVHNTQKSEGCKEMQSEETCFIKRKKGR